MGSGGEWSGVDTRIDIHTAFFQYPSLELASTSTILSTTICQCILGFRRFRGAFSQEGLDCLLAHGDDAAASPFPRHGPGLSSCLVSSALFRVELGRGVSEAVRIPIWSREEFHLLDSLTF